MLLLAVLAVLPPTVATAQQGTAELRLASQTPWNTPSKPTLDLAVDAANTGDQTLQDLSLVLTVYDALLSRSEFLISLTEDTGTPLVAHTYPLHLDIQPGETDVLRARLDVGFLEPLSSEARVYPIKVELLAGSQPVAELRTPLIFLPQKPKLPLAFGWTFVLGDPINFTSDGTVLGRELERSLAPGGTLRGEIGALHDMSNGKDAVPIDVVVSPTLVADLANMQDGYEVLTGNGVELVGPEEEGAVAASDALQRIRDLAHSDKVELSTMPYGVPDLPQLERSGLGQDVAAQIEAAREDMQQRGLPITWQVMRPPGSSLDAATLRDLQNLGVETLLVEAGVVEQPRQPKGFAPPAVALVGGSAAIVPDEGLDAIIRGPIPHEDPRLATQVLLGNLASVWLEQPDQPRAVALLVSGEQVLPAPFFESFVRETSAAPWLDHASADRLSQRFPSEVDSSYRVSRIRPIPDGYLARLEEARDLVAQWRSTQPAGNDTLAAESADRMLDRVLLAEGSYLVQREPRGLEWLDSVRNWVAADFARVRADTQQVVTLTASGGRIPVRITNGNDHVVSAKVELVSSRLRFPSGASRDLTLDPGETRVLVFEAAARTTGTFPVKVAVLTPTGGPMSETTITVRSTAFNRVALLITLAAVVVLVFVWVRRSRFRKEQ